MLTEAEANLATALLDSACQAVAHAMRPRQMSKVAELVRWPSPDPRTNAAFVLRTRMVEQVDLDRTLPFWEASGAQLTQFLSDMWNIDEGVASHLVGAAAQAYIAAGDDLSSFHVLRLAEAAWVWMSKP